MIRKSLDTESHARDMSGQILQDRLLKSKLSSSLREIRFSDWEFATDTLISKIQFNPLRFQINNAFYLFYD